MARHRVGPAGAEGAAPIPSSGCTAAGSSPSVFPEKSGPCAAGVLRACPPAGGSGEGGVRVSREDDPSARDDPAGGGGLSSPVQEDPERFLGSAKENRPTMRHRAAGTLAGTTAPRSYGFPDPSETPLEESSRPSTSTPQSTRRGGERGTCRGPPPRITIASVRAGCRRVWIASGRGVRRPPEGSEGGRAAAAAVDDGGPRGDFRGPAGPPGGGGPAFSPARFMPR